MKGAVKVLGLHSAVEAAARVLASVAEDFFNHSSGKC